MKNDLLSVKGFRIYYRTHHYPKITDKIEKLNSKHVRKSMKNYSVTFLRSQKKAVLTIAAAVVRDKCKINGSNLWSIHSNHKLHRVVLFFWYNVLKCTTIYRNGSNPSVTVSLNTTRLIMGYFTSDQTCSTSVTATQ